MPSEANGSEALLIHAIERLNRSWMQTAAGWNDKARMEFEKQYVDEFRLAAKRSAQAMRNIGALLSQIRKECGDNAN